MFKTYVFRCAVMLGMIGLFAVPVTAQSGLWQTEQEFIEWNDSQGQPWNQVAPGTWEMERPDGTIQRLGFGDAAFRHSLAQRQKEYVELLGQVGEQPQLHKRLEATAHAISFLQRSLAPAEQPATGVQQKASQRTGSVCAGNYDLDTWITHQLAGSTVDASASWSEFGPFAPYTKEMITYAEAQWQNGSQTILDSDYNSTGPFSGTCCVSVSSTAVAYPTYVCDLYSYAYLRVYSGCNAGILAETIGNC